MPLDKAASLDESVGATLRQKMVALVDPAITALEILQAQMAPLFGSTIPSVPIAAGKYASGTGEIVTTAAPYNAKCDAKTVGDLVSNGTAVVTSASAPFTSTAVDGGKLASIRVGASGVTTTILSVQSTTQATLNTTVPTGTDGIMTFGTNDTAAISSAVAAVPEGGCLVQPGESMITGAIGLSKHIQVRGIGVFEETGGIIDSTFGSGPSLPPYLRGSVFIQVTAGANGVEMTGTGKNVHCRDFGVRFAPAIMFSNTGHGFYAVPSAMAALPITGGHENGLFNARWDNLPVFGHDGNHYAHYILNSNLGTFTHLRGHGGGGLFLESDSHGAGYGNAVYIHPFYRVFCGGTANGFTLKCRDIDAIQPSLNLIHFVRPQCNILGSPIPPAFSTLGITAPTVAQYTWRNVKTGAHWPKWIFLDGPDLENDGVNNYPNDFGGMYSGTVVLNSGFIAIPPINGYSTPNRSSPGIPLSPVLTPGAGLGTGGDVDLIHGNDQGGVILVTVGTAPPAAAGSVLFTFQAPSMPPTGLKMANFWGYGDGGFAGVDFYTTGLSGNVIEVRCTTILGAGWAFQVMFNCVPMDTPNNSI